MNHLANKVGGPSSPLKYQYTISNTIQYEVLPKVTGRCNVQTQVSNYSLMLYHKVVSEVYKQIVQILI